MMKKSIKVLLLIILFLSVSVKCFAVNIDMNLGNTTGSSDALLSVDNTVSNSSTNTGVLAPTTTNTVSNATTDDQNLVVNTDIANSTTSAASNTTSSGTNSESSANVSNLSALPESDLGLTNILNIILIAIGFILILLAIAILIRISSK